MKPGIWITVNDITGEQVLFCKECQVATDEDYFCKKCLECVDPYTDEEEDF